MQHNLDDLERLFACGFKSVLKSKECLLCSLYIIKVDIRQKLERPDKYFANCEHCGSEANKIRLQTLKIV